MRIVQALNANWRFVQDDNLTDDEALDASGEDWETVSLPHTWNAEDAASLHATGYKRGLGWYRLAFATPTAGARHWLAFGAATLVADVWLNGEHLGQHRGGFTAFRFDITGDLVENGENELLVKVDNRGASEALTAIDPMSGDFNISGGLTRQVSLISTPSDVHFALGDLGGPGVYATTMAISDGDATVGVIAKVRSDADTSGDYDVRIALVDDAGAVAASGMQSISLAAQGQQDLAGELRVDNAHLWQGREDPYLYSLVAEIVNDQGEVIDKVVQKFGLREMRFDVDEGFFLNGQHVRLHGVAMHQDFLGKGWAISREDIDESLGLIMEIGANAVRFGHYPFPPYALERADELGLVIWAEKPNGQKTTVDPCSTPELSEDFMENALLQLEEMIRQQSNHACVATWCVGNESTFGLLSCDERYDTVRPYVQRLQDRAKELDPSRPTAYAEYAHSIPREPAYATEGMTDIYGTNRYFYWYSTNVQDFGPTLDQLHGLAGGLRLGVTEYGIGAALTHHTDNPRGGYPDVRSAPEGEVSWQPEEYAAWAHGQNYRVIDSKEYLFGSFVWNMFDFGSDHRNEGDVLGVNTKGLVTFDRRTRKDAFFFYKVNWTDEPVMYIVGRRYTDRAYAVNDVTVYSNADSVELSVNGEVVGTLTADEADYDTYEFEGVRLSIGENTVTAVGTHNGETIRDEVTWSLENEDVNIAAGQLATGFMSSEGDRFGSDHYFTGGEFVETPSTNIENTREPHLYERFRRGEFSYEIPLDNGSYLVRLGFIEPYEATEEGERVFDVTANGELILENFDILREAGDYRRVVTETFTADVSDGVLTLGFIPRVAGAVVSTIMVRRAE